MVEYFDLSTTYAFIFCSIFRVLAKSQYAVYIFFQEDMTYQMYEDAHENVLGCKHNFHFGIVSLLSLINLKVISYFTARKGCCMVLNCISNMKQMTVWKDDVPTRVTSVV